MNSIKKTIKCKICLKLFDFWQMEHEKMIEELENNVKFSDQINFSLICDDCVKKELKKI